MLYLALCVGCIVCRSARAADSPAIPKTLYHWTTFERLVDIAAGKTWQDPWDSYPTRRKSKFQDRYRGSGSNHLFAWSDPLTGMLGQSNEKYGDALVQLQINVPHSRVLFIDTAKTKKRHFDFSEIDLVYYRNGKYQEWIILNPKVVTSFTADPDVIAPSLAPWLKRIRDPNFRVDIETAHSAAFAESPNLHRYAETVISDFLSHRELVPSYFLRDRIGQGTFSRWIESNRLRPAIKSWRNDPLTDESYFRNNQYFSRVRHYDHRYEADGIQLTARDILEELKYRLNVASRFSMEEELSNAMTIIERSLPQEMGQAQLTKAAKDLRNQWVRGEVSSRSLLVRLLDGTYDEKSPLTIALRQIDKVEAAIKPELKNKVFGLKSPNDECSRLFKNLILEP